MNYARIMSRVLNQPLLMTPSNLTVFVSALSDRVGIDSLELGDGTTLDRDEMRATAQGASGRERKPYSVDDGVAIIPVVGTLVNKSGMVQPYSGMTGYDSIEARVWEALEDPNVDSILMDIDSGGGEVAGCFDTSDFLNEASSIKPIWAYAGELAASAAYAVGAAADRLYLPRTGTVGSVGVVVAHQSYEEALEDAGVKVTLIHSGDHKVEGNPYQDLPDDVRESIQGRIDTTRKLFAERVAAYRGMSVSAVMETEAAVYSGADAVSVGFADGIATFNEVLNMLKNKDGAAVIGAQASVDTGADTVEVVEVEEQAAVVAEQALDAIATEGEMAAAGITATLEVAEVADLQMNAVDIISACDTAGLPNLSSPMIKAAYTVEQVTAQLEQAVEINDLCVAAGVDSAEIVANLGNPVELVRSMLGLHEEAEIDSTHTGAIDEGVKPAMTTSELWKHRQDEASANRH